MTQADMQDILLEYVCTYYNILPVFAIVKTHALNTFFVFLVIAPNYCNNITMLLRINYV